jgi:hypothetical protein
MTLQNAHKELGSTLLSYDRRDTISKMEFIASDELQGWTQRGSS